MGARIDEYIFALSTEWMKKYYPFSIRTLQLINVDLIQECAQTSLKYLVGTGNNYYHCDRSSKHLNDTKLAFYNSLIKNGVSVKKVDNFFAYIHHNEDTKHAEYQLYWFFNHTTNDLVNGDIEIDFDNEKYSALRNNENYLNYLINFEKFYIKKQNATSIMDSFEYLISRKEWLESKHEFDAYAKSLTPDYELAVYDIVWSIMGVDYDESIFYWKKYTRNLISEEKKSLIKWYENQYLKFAQTDDLSLFKKWIY